MATHLTLDAETARDLMRPGAPALRDSADLAEALALLTDAAATALAVLNKSGQPVGVLSRDDIVVHEREKMGHAARGGEEPILARDLMTPAVFSVRPESPAAHVIEEMVAMHVNQLFVVDERGTLVGTITAFNVLERLSRLAGLKPAP
jgi:CBS domain-containing protein